MIYYFVTSAHRYTMDTYLQTWGASLGSRIVVREYSELATTRWLTAGTYIFSDLERLTVYQRALAAEVWKQLAGAGAPVQLFNSPARALLRPELLDCLNQTGRNEFKAWRISDCRTPARFPVFLRGANDHDGSRTPLLHTQEEVDGHIRAALCHGHDPRNLLIVEYCDTSDRNGVHHKYSAFCVGGKILPRHFIFSRNWVLKYPDLLDEEKLARERDYLENNPHEAALLETFRLAHIDYGRCDYAVVRGRIQVWEINTNPVVMLAPEEYKPAHLPAQEYFASRIRAAFEALDTKAPAETRIPLQLGSAVISRIIASEGKAEQDSSAPPTHAVAGLPQYRF